jgi:hypothetical protein
MVKEPVSGYERFLNDSELARTTDAAPQKNEFANYTLKL